MHHFVIFYKFVIFQPGSVYICTYYNQDGWSDQDGAISDHQKGIERSMQRSNSVILIFQRSSSIDRNVTINTSDQVPCCPWFIPFSWTDFLPAASEQMSWRVRTCIMIQDVQRALCFSFKTCHTSFFNTLARSGLYQGRDWNSRRDYDGGIVDIGGIKMAGLWRQAGVRWRDRDSFFFGINFLAGLWMPPEPHPPLVQ